LAKAFVAEELSPIQNPDAPVRFEKCGLVLLLIVLLVPIVVLWLAVMGDPLFNADIGRAPQLNEMRTEESVSGPRQRPRPVSTPPRPSRRPARLLEKSRTPVPIGQFQVIGIWGHYVRCILPWPGHFFQISEP
jgi:hypothetical protein